jgi:DNA polymerase I-like protein with 3'-5' exonuclease and polymerase domains
VDGREVWVYDEKKKEWKQLRSKAKAVFLGLTYGMGEAKMCKSCGFDTVFINIRGAEREVAGPEGKAFLKGFNEKVPFLGEIKEMVEKVAWNRKYIQTILGRHIHYPPGAGMERKALNNLIQGSAADQTKLAMVLMDEQNFRIQLQMHDEIATTIYEDKTATDMAEIMRTCVPLVVPSKVDVEIGANWGDSME